VPGQAGGTGPPGPGPLTRAARPDPGLSTAGRRPRQHHGPRRSQGNHGLHGQPPGTAGALPSPGGRGATYGAAVRPVCGGAAGLCGTSGEPRWPESGLHMDGQRLPAAGSGRNSLINRGACGAAGPASASGLGGPGRRTPPMHYERVPDMSPNCHQQPTNARHQQSVNPKLAQASNHGATHRDTLVLRRSATLDDKPGAAPHAGWGLRLAARRVPRRATCYALSVIRPARADRSPLRSGERPDQGRP